MPAPRTAQPGNGLQDRVQANDRVRDHFEALPPEDLAEVTSVEDLRQTITIFRALVGAAHVDEAEILFNGFGDVLLAQLGAYTTIIELVRTIACPEFVFMHSVLSNAYYYLGNYQEAIILDIAKLAYALQRKDSDGVCLNLDNISFALNHVGQLAAARRCTELEQAVYTAAGLEPDAPLVRSLGVRAANSGHAELARELLNQAEVPGVGPKALWLEDGIRCLRLELALSADQSLTYAQLDDAASRMHTWAGRRNILRLRCLLSMQDGKSREQALAVAQESERMDRDAGLNVAPVYSAFALAKLGRTAEAAAAAEESVAIFPRIHPGQRPHYELALALRELGRRPEAIVHAREAYRQAWADGPPNCRYWALRDGRELMESMDEPLQDLPVVDPASVQVPLEEEVMAFIAELEAGRRKEEQEEQDEQEDRHDGDAQH